MKLSSFDIKLKRLLFYFYTHNAFFSSFVIIRRWNKYQKIVLCWKGCRNWIVTWLSKFFRLHTLDISIHIDIRGKSPHWANFTRKFCSISLKNIQKALEIILFFTSRLVPFFIAALVCSKIFSLFSLKFECEIFFLLEKSFVIFGFFLDIFFHFLVHLFLHLIRFNNIQIKHSMWSFQFW